MGEVAEVFGLHGPVPVENWQQFVLAGRAVFTVENRQTGNRFTFRARRHEDKDLWFIAVLAGPDNEHDYTYGGPVFGDQFRRTRASKVGEEAPSFQVFAWLMRLLGAGKDLPTPVKFYHEGQCGRCGKRLTVPESVRTGYGPGCWPRMHG